MFLHWRSVYVLSLVHGMLPFFFTVMITMLTIIVTLVTNSHCVFSCGFLLRTVTQVFLLHCSSALQWMEEILHHSDTATSGDPEETPPLPPSKIDYCHGGGVHH